MFSAFLLNSLSKVTIGIAFLDSYFKDEVHFFSMFALKDRFG